MKSVDLPESRCAACGHLFEAATPVRGYASPGPGDYTMCINCGVLHRFNEDMTVRAATKADYEELDDDAREDVRRGTVAILTARNNRIRRTGDRNLKLN